MPTYDYHCDACSADVEVFQSIKAEPLNKCPECAQKGRIKRKISSGSGIIFKGSGFYETDYKQKAASEKKSGAEQPAKTSTQQSSDPSSSKKAAAESKASSE